MTDMHRPEGSNQQQESQRQGVENKSDERIYFGLMERVGSLGNYQTNVFVILCLVSLAGSSTFFVNPYLFYQEPYQCPQLQNQHCKEFVCALPEQLRKSYSIEPRIYTLGNHYGDLHCQRQSQMTAMQSSMLLGASIGLLMSVLFTDFIGRKATIVSALFIVLLGISIIMLVGSPKYSCIGLFLWGAGAQISFTILFSYATQIAAQSHRTRYYVHLLFFFAFGTLANTILFYLLGNWLVVLAFYYFLMNAIAIVGFIVYIQNTPIQLISRYTAEQAYNAFIRIAVHNSVTEHGITLEEIAQLQQEYKFNQKKKQHDYKFTFLDLFRYASVRSDFIKMGCFFFLMMFQLYAPALLMDQLNMDIFLDGLTNGLSQLITIPVLLIISEKYPRQKYMTIFMACSTLFAFIYFLASKEECTNCQTNQFIKWINLSIFFVFRFFTNLTSNFFSTILNQTFPAQIRAIAIYSVVSLGRLSTLAIPFLTKLRDNYHIPLMLVFTIGCGICTICASFLRETVNIPPAEIIEQLKFNHKVIVHHKQNEV